MSKSSEKKSAKKRKRPPLGTLEELAVFAIDGQLGYMSVISSFMLDKRVPERMKGMRDQNPLLKAAEPNSDKARLAAEVRKLVPQVQHLVKNGEMEVAHVATVMELTKSFEALYLHVFGEVEAMKRGRESKANLALGPKVRAAKAKQKAAQKMSDLDTVMSALKSHGQQRQQLIKGINKQKFGDHLTPEQRAEIIKRVEGYKHVKEMVTRVLAAEILDRSVSSTYPRKK